MAEENEYATPKAFLDLYHSFTGSADPSYPAKTNIGGDGVSGYPATSRIIP